MRFGALPSHHVQVGVAHDAIDYVLPFAYSARYHSITGITVGVTVGPSELTFACLDKGSLDFVITDRVIEAHRSLDSETLYENPLFVVSAAEHPLAARQRLSTADLVAERWAVRSGTVKFELCEMFQRRGLPLPDIAVHAGSSRLYATTLASSRLLGVQETPTVLALAEVRAHLAVLSVEDFAWARPILAVYAGTERLSPAARRLLDDLKALAVSETNLA